MRYKKEVFYIEGGKTLNRFPGEMVDSPSLETFKVWLDEALRNLVWLSISLLLAGALD